MNKSKEEKAGKELNIAVSKLLECYQWDHLPPKKDQAIIRLHEVKIKLNEVERLLGSKDEENL